MNTLGSLLLVLGGALWLYLKFIALPSSSGKTSLSLETLSGIVGIVGLAFVVGTFTFTAPRKLWEKDAPLRRIRDEQEVHRSKYIWAILSPVELRADGRKVYLTVSLISQLVESTEVRGIHLAVLYDNQEIAHTNLAPQAYFLHFGACSPHSKELILPQLLNGMESNRLTCNVLIDTDKGQVEIKGLYQSVPHNGG